MAIATADLPERIQLAAATLQDLAAKQVYFVPVRHHSPACSMALQQWLAELKPQRILIEAPTEFLPLLPLLQHEDTVPPVAVLAQRKQGEQVRSAFYPFCDYSPEWLALRWAKAAGAQVVFCDLLSLDDDDSDTEGETLLQAAASSLLDESHVAHSEYVQALAAKLHCRNYDELWSHVFECRTDSDSQHPAQFFNDVWLWCAMARLSYTEEALQLDDTVARERCMLQHLQAAIDSGDTTVVITGGFHTLGLLEGMAGKASVQVQTPKARKSDSDAWLIRYSFDRLDALNGYASGMPSPQYYQNQWQARQQAQPASDFLALQLSGIAAHLREEKLMPELSVWSLQQAQEQAWRLAMLRGHGLPSRWDLLDAIVSTWMKDEAEVAQQQVSQAILRFLSGHQLGQVVKSAAVPPLVNQVLSVLKAQRYKLSDTLPKSTELSIYRDAAHRERSAFLHLLAFIDVGFATLEQGPDLISGANMDLLNEHWRYAWTPMVEARLIDLSAEAADIYGLAQQRLLKQQQSWQEQGHSHNASGAMGLLIQAARMGLEQSLPDLLQAARYHIEHDSRWPSQLSAINQICNLWQARRLFPSVDETVLKAMLLHAWNTSLFLLQQLHDLEDEANAAQVRDLVTQRLLARRLAAESDFELASAVADFYRHLRLYQRQYQNNALLSGAIDGLLFLDGQSELSELQQAIAARMQAGSDALQAAQYFNGLMQAAPELLVHQPVLIDALDGQLQRWGEDEFIALLPSLRLAFSQLNPRQINQISAYVADQYQTDAVALSQVNVVHTEAQMLAALSLNQDLQAALQAEGLGHWLHTMGNKHADGRHDG